MILFFFDDDTYFLSKVSHIIDDRTVNTEKKMSRRNLPCGTLAYSAAEYEECLYPFRRKQSTYHAEIHNQHDEPYHLRYLLFTRQV